MKQVFSIFILILTGSLLLAQGDYKSDYKFEVEPKENKNNSYQAIYYNLHLDIVGGVNNLLRSNDYPQLNDLGNQLGLRFAAGRGKKIAGIFDASYYFRNTVSSETLSNSASLTGWSAGLGLEYTLFETKALFLKPMLQINYARYTFNFVENAGVETIDGIINSDFKEYNFRSSQFPAQAGVNLGAKLNVDDSFIGIMIGVGYILNYENDSWIIGQNTNVTDTINPSSPYVNIALFSSMD